MADGYIFSSARALLGNFLQELSCKLSCLGRLGNILLVQRTQKGRHITAFLRWSDKYELVLYAWVLGGTVVFQTNFLQEEMYLMIPIAMMKSTMEASANPTKLCSWSFTQVDSALSILPEEEERRTD